MHWLALALLSAISLAAADTLTKRFFADYHGWDLMLVRFTVPGLILLPLALAHPIPAVPAEFWLWVAVLVPLELVAMLLYMLAIRDSPLYLTLPYLAFTPVFTVLTGYLVLHETVSAQGFAGILLVVLGAYLLNLDEFRPKDPRGWWAPLGAILDQRGSRLMLVVAAIYAFTSVLGKYVLGFASPESFGPFYFVLIGSVVLLLTVPLRTRALGVLLRRPAPTLAVGALMALMVVTHFIAIARVEAAYFISVKRSSLLFGIVFGALIFRERHMARHFVAGALMIGGVALIVA